MKRREERRESTSDSAGCRNRSLAVRRPADVSQTSGRRVRVTDSRTSLRWDSYPLVLLPPKNSIHLLRSDELFYSHSTSQNYADSLQFCESLGGQLAANFTKDDRPFLQSLIPDSTKANWLDAEWTTSGYRWRLPGRLIDPEMWLPGYPNCGGNCAVCCMPDGYLIDRSATDTGCDPLCVFDMLHEAAYIKLLTRLSPFYVRDTAALQLTILKYTQEKQISQLMSSMSQKSNFNLVVIIFSFFIIIFSIMFALVHIRITRVDRSLNDHESKLIDAAAEQPIYMSSLLTNDLLVHA